MNQILTPDVALRLVRRASVLLGERANPADARTMVVMAQAVLNAGTIPGLDDESVAQAKQAARILVDATK